MIVSIPWLIIDAPLLVWIGRRTSTLRHYLLPLLGILMAVPSAALTMLGVTVESGASISHAGTWRGFLQAWPYIAVFAIEHGVAGEVLGLLICVRAEPSITKLPG